jgi:pyrroline-5-carboxylate reductase
MRGTITGKRLTFIGGAGKIGSAILNGLIAAKRVLPAQITITARHAASLKAMKALKLKATTENIAAIHKADVVVLCVHPDEVHPLLTELAPHLTKQHLVISIVSGCTTRELEQTCDHALRAVRAMPNTPVSVGEAMTCLAKGAHATTRDLALAQEIFSTVGLVEVLDEHHMDAATGLGGCGPAFAFKIIEALSEGGVKMGLPRDLARTMAAQVLKGAAELVLTTGLHPAALKDAVTTPGGCTIDGLTRLEERGLSIALIDAVETATRKSRELLPPKK